jgi:hypothetical protein
LTLVTAAMCIADGKVSFDASVLYQKYLAT